MVILDADIGHYSINNSNNINNYNNYTYFDYNFRNSISNNNSNMCNISYNYRISPFLKVDNNNSTYF